MNEQPHSHSLPGDHPKILIVKMWALGDILMATPLLRAIKRQWPGCSIHWLVRDTYAPVLIDNPLLDRVIAFDSALWQKQFRYGNLPAYLRTSLSLRRELLAERYDVVINLTAEKWWSIWFNAAPMRIGLFPRARPGLLGHILYTDAIERTTLPRLHNTRHYMLPAKALGIPEPYDERMVLGVSDARRQAVDEFLKSDPAHVSGRPIIVLHPGTSQATKCWPAEQFALLADRLVEHNIVVTGSAAERPLADRIASITHRGVTVAAGKLQSIGETAALIERSAAVVTGDTSVLHIASALDVPLIGIYGSTRPGDNAPLFGRSELLFDDSIACAPCYKSKCPLAGDKFMACLTGITVDRVLAALRNICLPAISDDDRLETPEPSR